MDGNGLILVIDWGGLMNCWGGLYHDGGHGCCGLGCWVGDLGGSRLDAEK